MFVFFPHEIYVWARVAINSELRSFLIFEIGFLCIWLILLIC